MMSLISCFDDSGHQGQAWFLVFCILKIKKKNIGGAGGHQLMSSVVWIANASLWSASFYSLWSYDIFCISNLPSLVINQSWSPHYMQKTTLISVFMVELRSSAAAWARPTVRSDRPISEFSPRPESLAVQIIPTTKTEAIQKLFCGTSQKYLNLTHERENIT